MDYLQLAKKFIKEKGGYEQDPYLDHNKNLTVGYGANVSNPATRDVMQRLGLSDVSSPEDAEKLMDAQLQEKERIARSRVDFDNLDDNQKAAVLSLAYNNPELIGPNLSRYINEGSHEEAAKEILLRSNREKAGGPALRRLDESLLYSGGSLPMLGENEIRQIESQVNRIKNPHTRKQSMMKVRKLLRGN